MGLTAKQKEIIEKAKILEGIYGQDNIFIRYVNTAVGCCFIIHRCGETSFKVACDSVGNPVKVNRRTINSLEEKGLVDYCDSFHNINANPNNRNIQYVGLRIKTENI